MPDTPDSSRRRFVGGVGRLASGLALTGVVPVTGRAMVSPSGPTIPSDWDMSWLEHLASGTDRAVFDWPTLSEPSNSIELQIASRYAENCAEVYPTGSYELRIVLNVRTRAVPAAMSDALWARFNLGVEYGVKDPATDQPARRNPYLHRTPSGIPGPLLPTLTDLLDIGATVLVCDFSLGHLATRLAKKEGAAADTIHRELRAGFVANAYAVPSGIFGLARAQNAGCAFVRV